MESVKLFCPATIANLSCGFDVLGACLDTVGDEMIIKRKHEIGINISKISGQDLPLDPKKNVAGVAIQALINSLPTPPTFGLEIEIYKHIKPGSGIGSSAASAAGAVFGANMLLNNPFSTHQLINFAMQGEQLASGSLHADNVAPALLGGFTLVRSYTPLDVIKLHTPKALFATIIHPQIEVKTADSRSVLKQQILLKQAVQQWGNVGGLVSGLYTEDYNLIARSLEDVIVEPLRSVLIPEFANIKHAALQAGALGSGISGSGPSIFALSKGEETATKVAQAMSTIYKSINLPHSTYVSKINNNGIKILN